MDMENILKEYGFIEEDAIFKLTKTSFAPPQVIIINGQQIKSQPKEIKKEYHIWFDEGTIYNDNIEDGTNFKWLWIEIYIDDNLEYQDVISIYDNEEDILKNYLNQIV